MVQNWFTSYWFRFDTLRAFSWEEPYYLFLLGLIPTAYLIRWAFRNQSREKLAITIEASMNSRLGNIIINLRFLPDIFLSLAVACLIAALARPQRVLQSTENYSEGIDIMVALDISESMKSRDLMPDRLAAAKKITQNFIAGRLQDRIGLVAFTGKAYLLCPPTTDYQVLREIIEDLEPNTIPADGTALGEALGKCVNRLRDITSPSKVIILISDGTNTEDGLNPTIVAKLAPDFGIKIYTVLVGSNKKSADVEPIDEKGLRDIAKFSKGNFFAAADNQSLQGIFNEINRIEQVKIKAMNQKDIRDFYYIYITWGIVFFLFSMITKSTFMGNVLED